MRGRRLGPAIILAAIMTTLSMLQPTAAAPQAATEAAPKAAAPVTVKVMSFNIWVGGTQVDFGQVMRAIQTAGADIVGVQEPGGNLARLATELGWYHHAGQNVVSRYPLVDPGDGGPYVYAVVAPGQAVAVSNVHLTAYPYGPYDLRDGASVATVLANEQRIHMSEMDSRFQKLPAVAASGVPVFLTGDFNVPSHLDWTEARRPEHFGYAVRWPVSAELERLGFRDPYRQVHPDPSADHGHTWTPGYPPPDTDPDEVHDRIDFVYAIGPSTTTASQVVGESAANADIVVSPWPSDHRAVVSTFTATPAPLPHSVATDRADYAPGAPIKVDFAGPGNSRDWIGIYREGDTPGSVGSQYWKYVGGSQTPGGAVANGSVTFDAASPGEGAGSWPPPPGNYRVHLLENDGHRILASASFRVLAAGQVPTVTTAKASYRSGENVSVSFSNASGHASSWVGIYPAGVTPGSQASYRWAYLNGRTSGSVTLGRSQSGSTWPLPVGSYRVHLFRDGGYVVDASTTFDVVAR
jgi:endonuclease/exonuclease/phosphatase family metal-dependent hydrolase